MNRKIQILAPENFPTLLKQTHKPPQKLYYIGNPEALNKTMIAVVGTRRCTPYGIYHTKKIIQELSILDVTIVSGLAKGIDTAAHRAALANGLPTIAVLGNGLSQIYPRENQELAESITQTGLLLSQFPPHIPPTKSRFPQRNQIISGLSVATIVIEAPERSGALITANFALSQGRDIFALPADVDRTTSHGILRLLQKPAAYPIKDGREIIEILSHQPKLLKTKRGNLPTPQALTPSLKLAPAEKLILSLLQKTRSTTFQTLMNKTNLCRKMTSCRKGRNEIVQSSAIKKMKLENGRSISKHEHQVWDETLKNEDHLFAVVLV